MNFRGSSMNVLIPKLIVWTSLPCKILTGCLSWQFCILYLVGLSLHFLSQGPMWASSVLWIIKHELCCHLTHLCLHFFLFDGVQIVIWYLSFNLSNLTVGLPISESALNFGALNMNTVVVYFFNLLPVICYWNCDLCGIKLQLCQPEFVGS